jgi:hypothetical protein
MPGIKPGMTDQDERCRLERINVTLPGRINVTLPGGSNYTDAVVTPPSTTMVWPVMKVEASEAR